MRPLSSVASYLETLPGGTGAYPDCVVKGSVLRTYLDDRPFPRDVDLPPAMREILHHPPPVTAWVPEVLFNAFAIAFREVHFGASDDAGYFSWVYAKNRKLFSTPLYRALFLLISPERLLVGLEKRWGSFRRGTTPLLERLGDKHVELRVSAPPRLYSPLVVNGMAEAIRASITSAGAIDAWVDGSLRGDGALYRIRWR